MGIAQNKLPGAEAASLSAFYLLFCKVWCFIQEPLEFNNFLRDLATKCRGKRLNDFWQRVMSKEITLISKDEAPDRYEFLVLKGSRGAPHFVYRQKKFLAVAHWCTW